MTDGLLKKFAGGKYLSSEDFGDRIGKSAGIVVTIKDFSEENVARENQAPEYKLILHFEECKPLACNKTNTNMIIGLFGSDEQKCVGKKIGLYVRDDIEHKGKTVKGLRLCDKNEIAEGDFDNDIPF